MIKLQYITFSHYCVSGSGLCRIWIRLFTRGSGSLDPMSFRLWSSKNLVLPERNTTGTGIPLTPTRGRILGRKPEKSLESFPPRYSQSPWDFYFLKLTQPLTVSVKEENLIETPSLWFNKSICRNLKSENPQDYTRKPQVKFYVHEFGFSSRILKETLRNASLVMANEWEEAFFWPIADSHPCCDIQQRMRLSGGGGSI